MPREICPRLLRVGLVLLSTLEAIKSSELHSSQSNPELCHHGLEFWSTDKSGCTPCTKCAPEFTISPCAVHKDAICGPLSALELDWSFLGNRRKSDINQRLDVTEKMMWRVSNVDGRPETLRSSESRREIDDELSASGLDDDEGLIDPQQLQISPEVPKERRSSNDNDHLPWDWQTSALVLAVCACIVFFMVAGCSALIYVRQWRRMKRNFQPAGLEEISARLNLMVKAELAELSAGAPMNPGDPETRCQYLEKLLDRKRETPVVAGWPEAGGNLYIEEGETSRSKRAQISRIQRNIESILSHKTTRD
ncbi:uncharacterized protein wgn [Fopius arisanus]|uniref:Uncharacterized protein wgn n=2 Tax=Braconidae TaxID=7402 RepID=A0A9R1SY61_9HYME|nr:PREDICTED: uncharacterized protein LOC105264248 [Fopius arisanus]